MKSNVPDLMLQVTLRRWVKAGLPAPGLLAPDRNIGRHRRLDRRARCARWGYGQRLSRSHLGVSMGTTAIIGLGVLTWVVVAVLVALFLARMIKLRDRQGQTGRRTPDEGRQRDGADAPHTVRRGWRLRSKT